MWNVGPIILSFLLSFSLYANNCAPVSSEYSCKGTIKVTSHEELQDYLSDFGLNKKKTFIRNLKLEGNFSGVLDLNISTPCRVNVAEASRIEITGSLCINSGDNIHFAKNHFLRASEVNLSGPKKVVIRDHLNAVVSGDFNLISTGDSEYARAHIRHSSNVQAKNLSLIALRRATLGHSSSFVVEEKITVNSNGEDLGEETSEWSSFWHDSIIQAREIEASALKRVRVGNRVTINADKLILNARECSISKRAVLNTGTNEGNCFSGLHPTAKFKVSSKKIELGETLGLDASKSNYVEGSTFTWTFDQGIQRTTNTPLTSFTYAQAGIYKIELKITTPEGFYSRTKRKVEVIESNKPELESIAYFTLALNGKGDTLKIKNASSLLPSEIVEGKYIINGVDLLMSDFYPNTGENYSVALNDVVDIKQILVDREGKTHEYQKIVTINGESSMHAEFKVEQAGVKKVFLNGLRTYDFFDEDALATVNWGDGNTSELDSYFATHEYAVDGTYEVTLTLSKDGAESVSKSVSVNVDSTDPGPLQPVASFEREKPSFAKHIRFYVDQSGTPNGEILSYQWDLGNGETANGNEVIAFYDPGVYQISLQVTDSLGLRNTQIQQIVVTENGPPIIANVKCEADFLFADCEGVVLHKEKMLDRVRFRWGDGSNDEFYNVGNSEWEIFNKGHLYANEGTYEIQFRGFTTDGQQVTHKRQVSLIAPPSENQPPIANLNCVVDEYTQVSCDSFNSFDPDGFIVRKTYSLSDGSQYSDMDFLTHDFGQSGIYTIELEIEDNLGAISTAQTQIEVFKMENQPPVALGVCVSENIRELTCRSSSYDTDGSITEEIWTLDSGEQLSGSEVTFSNLEERPYNVSLQVKDNEMSSAVLDISEVAIKEAPEPIAIISPHPDDIEPLVEVEFSGEGSFSGVLNDENLEYQWFLNDEEVSLQESFSMSLDRGKYNIRLIVKNQFGKTESVNSEILVGVAPSFSLSNIDPKVVPFTVLASLEDLVIGEEGDLSKISWILNGQEVCTSVTCEFTVENSGTSTLKVEVYNSLGISSSKRVWVNGIPDRFDLRSSEISKTLGVGNRFTFRDLFRKDQNDRIINLTQIDGDSSFSIENENIVFNGDTHTSSGLKKASFLAESDGKEEAFSVNVDVIQFVLKEEHELNGETNEVELDFGVEKQMVKVTPPHSGSARNTLQLFEGVGSDGKRSFGIAMKENTEYPFTVRFENSNFVLTGQGLMSKLSLSGLSPFEQRMVTQFVRVCGAEGDIAEEVNYFIEYVSDTVPENYFTEMNESTFNSWFPNTPKKYKRDKRFEDVKIFFETKSPYANHSYETILSTVKRIDSTLYLNSQRNVQADEGVVRNIYIFNRENYIKFVDKSFDPEGRVSGFASISVPESIFLREETLFERNGVLLGIFMHEQGHVSLFSQTSCKEIYTHSDKDKTFFHRVMEESSVEYLVRENFKGPQISNMYAEHLSFADNRFFSLPGQRYPVLRYLEEGFPLQESKFGLGLYGAFVYFSSGINWRSYFEALDETDNDSSQNFKNLINKKRGSATGFRDYILDFAETIMYEGGEFSFLDDTLRQENFDFIKQIDSKTSIDGIPFLGLRIKKIKTYESSDIVLRFKTNENLTLDVAVYETIHNTYVVRPRQEQNIDFTGVWVNEEYTYRAYGSDYNQSLGEPMYLFFNNSGKNPIGTDVEFRPQKIEGSFAVPSQIAGTGRKNVTIEVLDLKDSFDLYEGIDVHPPLNFEFNSKEKTVKGFIDVGVCGEPYYYPISLVLADKFGYTITKELDPIRVVPPKCPKPEEP